MRKYFFMGLGCATGFFLFIIAISGITYCSTLFTDRVEDDRIGIHNNQYEERIQIQYFDVTTRKGTFTLHTDMPKDSVMLLMGKPDKTNVMSIGNDIHEDYEFKKSEYDFVRIEFINGLLKNVSDF